MTQTSPGARLRAQLDELGLAQRQLVLAMIGRPVGERYPHRGDPHFGKAESARRQLTRWLSDDAVMEEPNARELVGVLNRLRRARSLEPLPAEFLVTERWTRRANLAEIEAKIDRLLVMVGQLIDRQGRNGSGS